MSNVSLIDGHDDHIYRVPRTFGVYKKQPLKPIYKEGSKEANALFAACENEIQKQIVRVIFIEGYTTEEAENIIGYSARQLYRLKKKLKERAGL